MSLSTFNTLDPYVKRAEIPGLVGQAVSVSNKVSGGSIGTAATTVDIASSININQTTASQTLTLPNPTDTGLDTEISINSVGSTSFTILSTVLQPGTGIIVVWTGSAWSVIGTSSGATNVTVAGGKTFTVSNTLTLAGTDGTTMTFPTANDTVVGLTATQTLTNKTLTTPTLTTPVIATGLSASGSASNDFSTSTGTFKTSSGANTLSGAVTINDATTPSLTTAAGKTNTGYIQINGKTSGALKLIAADSAGQTVTISLAAQTTGAATLTIPDMANTAGNMVISNVSQTLTNKTLTTPVINGATSASGNFDLSGSNGTFLTSTGANTMGGAVSIADATTPSLTTASGKTNTGYVQINGKTSGALKITTADSTAQTVTISLAAQTSGSATLTIPDLAGSNTSLVTLAATQTLTNKTLTAPVIGVATGTSLAVTGLLTSSSSSAGIGYATGAGGAVTQASSRTTGVTVNTVAGAITLVSAAGTTSWQSFTVTNSSVAATDTVIVSQKSGTDLNMIFVTAVGTGSFRISFATTGGTTTEQPVFNFAVIKSVAA